MPAPPRLRPARPPPQGGGHLAALALVAVVLCGAGCPSTDPPRDPIELALRISTRQSCGIFSGLDYDTRCLAAVAVRVLDPQRKTIWERCVVLDERATELRELLDSMQLISIPGLSANKSVRFEVRGLHDLGPPTDGGPPVCDHPERTDQWLFWGESDLIDLSTVGTADAGGGFITVIVDCRDCSRTCADEVCFGCGALGIASCPTSFPTSFCVPAGDLSCAKPCSTDANCFDGARTCDSRTHTCDATDRDGLFCAPCGTVDGGPVTCEEGFTCVARPGELRGLCAPLCPDEVCPTGTKCNRLHNGIVVLDAPG